MTDTSIEIVRRGEPLPARADVIVVIDVLRAFSAAYTAFLGGAKGILLVPEVDDALALKRRQPDHVLVGEVEGLPIPGFDAGNSPQELQEMDLQGRTLVLRTTNGVAMTVVALDHAPEVLATGFSHAAVVAGHLRRCAAERDGLHVVLLASHPTSDDDYACAEHIRSLVLGDGAVTAAQTIERIRRSECAAKFLDPDRHEFDPRDLDLCTRELPSRFIMAVHRSSPAPMIVPRPI